MLRRMGLLLGFAAVFLQIAVFLQPLLPKQYQIAPVCETITQVIQFNISTQADHAMSSSMAHAMEKSMMKMDSHDHHDFNHQCQYCTVYGHLILPPELEIHPVLIRIQVRLLSFIRYFQHIYFALQRLFLIPQGRAPPVFA